MTERNGATINNSTLTKEERAQKAAMLSAQGKIAEALLLFFGLGDDYADEPMSNPSDGSGSSD